MTRIVELAKFRVRPGSEPALVREHKEALSAVQRAFPGLLRVHLIHLGDNVWADVAEWADPESAEAAKRGAMDLPEFARWTRHVVADLSLDHGVVHSALTGEARAVRAAGN